MNKTIRVDSERVRIDAGLPLAPSDETMMPAITDLQRASLSRRHRFWGILAVGLLLVAAPLAWRYRPLNASERRLIGEWRYYPASPDQNKESLRFRRDRTLAWNSGRFDDSTEFEDRNDADSWAFWNCQNGRLTVWFTHVRPISWDWSSPLRTLRNHVPGRESDVAVDGKFEFLSEEEFSITPFLQEPTATFRRRQPR